jgi:hypothetical protein
MTIWPAWRRSRSRLWPKVGVSEAAAPTDAWAERWRATLPSIVATERELAVGQLASGDFEAAAGTLAASAQFAPRDAGAAAQYDVAPYLLGDLAQSRVQVDRALDLDSTDERALQVREALAAPAPQPAGQAPSSSYCAAAKLGA